MNLNQLYYFQTIANLEHYHQAALELNISQPSLSKAMSNLEEEIGLYLFEKQGRNIILTKYGKIFLEHVNKIIYEIESTQKRMENLASSEEGHIDIAYVAPLSKHYIPHVARAFLEKEGNTKVTFSFAQEYTDKMIIGLKADKYDVVFGSFVENQEDLIFIPIKRQDLVVIVPKGHPLADRKTIKLADIEKYSVIAYDKNSGLGKFTRKIFKEYNIAPNIICESSDESSILSLVESSFGVALVARVYEVEKADITILTLEDLKVNHDIYMIYKKNRYMAPAARNFISFIKQVGE